MNEIVRAFLVNLFFVIVVKEKHVLILSNISVPPPYRWKHGGKITKKIRTAKRFGEEFL